MSNFSFFPSVFKRLVLKTRKTQGLFGKGLKSLVQTRAAVLHSQIWLDSLPHDKIFHQSKLKVFADYKLKVTKMIMSVFDRVENIVGKGEIVCTSNFSFSHNVFKRPLLKTRQKASLCGNGLTTVTLIILFNPIPNTPF